MTRSQRALLISAAAFVVTTASAGAEPAAAPKPVCLDHLAIYDHIADIRPTARLAFYADSHRGLTLEIWTDAAGWFRIERGDANACIVDSGSYHTTGGGLRPCLVRASIEGISADDARAADVCP